MATLHQPLYTRLLFESGSTSEFDDVQLEDWVVQRRCPHLRADLTKTGKIEDGVLTCSLHDWKWDLASGKCLTTTGHPIRSQRIIETADAPAIP